MEQEKVIKEVLEKMKLFYSKLEKTSIKIEDTLEVNQVLTNEGNKNYSLKAFINLINETAADLLPASSANLCNLVNNIGNSLDYMSLSLIEKHCDEIEEIINKVLLYRRKIKDAKVRTREYLPVKKILIKIIDIFLNCFTKFVCELSIIDNLTVADAYKSHNNININLNISLSPDKIDQLNIAVKLLKTDNFIKKIFYRLLLNVIIF